VETLAERVKRLRNEQGLAAVALAKAVGVSTSAIRQIESGTVKAPSVHVALRLARALNVELSYLVFGEADRLLRDRIAALEQQVAELERRDNV
jgi:transcriptional regulator with XRE-family HTH domain